MKKIYLTVISIVTVILCVCGFLYHVGYFKKWNLKTMGEKGTVESTSENLSDSIRLSGFSSIDIDAKIANLEITYGTGTEPVLSYRAGSEKLVPKASVNNGVLQVKQNASDRDLSLLGNFSQEKNCDITISLPQAASCDSIEVDTGVGNINVSGVTANELELDIGVGDVELQSCQIEDISIDNGTGNTTIKDSHFTKLDIDAGVGNVNVSGVEALPSYTLDIDSGMGALTINGASTGGLGHEYKQKGTGNGKIEIDAGVGNVELSESNTP